MSVDGVALIVGGGGGIGSESGFSFAAAGARIVVFADIKEDLAKKAAEKSKQYATHPEYRALSCHVDITDIASLQRMIDFTVEAGGRLDYAVNSAGTEPFSYKPLGEINIDDYDRVMNINAKGMFLSMRVQIQQMEKQTPRQYQSRVGTRDIGRGAIVNIASAHSYVGLPDKMAYMAAKHADLAFLKSAVLEYASKGIRINALCPTFVWTRMVEDELKHTDTALKIVETVVPIKRMAEAQEVGDAALWFCGPHSTYVNGVAMMMDAGACLTVRLT